MWSLKAAWRAAQGNARHRPEYAATRLPQAGPLEAHAEVLYLGHMRRKRSINMRQRRREAKASDSNSSKVRRREG